MLHYIFLKLWQCKIETKLPTLSCFQEYVIERLSIISYNSFRAIGFHKSRSASSPYDPALQGSSLITPSLWKVIMTDIFSLNWPTGPIQSSSRDVRVSVCLFDVPFCVVYFEAYFAPTSRSRMSKNFRDSESLGESAGIRIEHFCWDTV